MDPHDHIQPFSSDMGHFAEKNVTIQLKNQTKHKF